MSKSDTGGPAFPVHAQCGDQEGMTLRDAFAMKAMPIAAAMHPKGHERGWYGVADICYRFADAMLEARRK